MRKRLGFLAINAPTSTNYVSGQQFVPTSRVRCSGTSKKFRKICVFAPLFVQYVFANFSTNTAPIILKFSRRCQWAPTMLVQWSDRSRRAFLGFRLGTETISAKTVFFDTFFHKLAKRVDVTNVTAGKERSTCCVAPLVTALPQALN